MWLVHVPVQEHVVGVELEEQRGPKRCWIQIQFRHLSKKNKNIKGKNY